MDQEQKIKLGYLENPVQGLEIVDFICGPLIGSGCYRDVYEYNLDNRWAVKVENEDAQGDNFSEFRVWGAIKETKHKKWFAECSWISNNGVVMLQRKTKPPRTKENKIPDKIPHFFTDLKESNFGWIGNQFKCHDYSNTLEMMTGCGGMTNKMKKLKFNS